MADITGITNLTSASDGATSLTGIKAAATSLSTSKVETSVTVNGHALSSNVTVTNGDLGAVPTSTTVNGKALSSNVTLGLASSDFANQGTTTTVLHGAAAGNPAFGAVVEADITLADNTTNDVSTSRHGLVPKAPNDTTKFLRGDGTWNVPGTAISYAGAAVSSPSSTTQNVDRTHTTNFTPKVIYIHYYLQGYDAGGSGVASSGIAAYDGTTLKGNWTLFINTAVATNVTTSMEAVVATAPTTGTGTGSGIKIDLSILSVSATNFVVREAFTQAGASGATAQYYVTATA